jgi:hypothetical protein
MSGATAKKPNPLSTLPLFLAAAATEIVHPSFGKKQPQRQHDRHFTSRQCQRHQGLAVRGLAQRRSILRSDTYRPFLGIAVSSITSTASLPPTSLSA